MQTRKYIVSILVLSFLSAGCAAEVEAVQIDQENEEEIMQVEEQSTDEDVMFSNVLISDYEQLNETEMEVLYAYAGYWQAMSEQNMDIVEAMIPDTMTFTHMSGKTQTKEEYLKDVEDGKLNYTKIEIANPEITLDGAYACITCTTTLTANAYGAQGSWPFQGSRWMYRQNGVWQLSNAPDQ